MKRRRNAWLGVAAASLASLVLGGCGPRATGITSVLAPLEGDWIRRDTLETLTATRSPRTAASGEVVAFTLARSLSGFDWTLHPGFHESSAREIRGAVREGEEIRLEHDEETSSDTFILAGDELDWLHRAGAETSRTRFAPARPSLTALVNRVVLAGEYRDGWMRVY
jgi:hypothetical protein